MAIKLDDYLAKLPIEEQKAIEVEGARLIAEEAGLRDLRKARRQSQKDIAKRLGVNQAAISKMERRTDIYVSSLRELIEAMGGELEIVARFPDRPSVRITQFKAMKGEIIVDSAVDQ